MLMCSNCASVDIVVRDVAHRREKRSFSSIYMNIIPPERDFETLFTERC